MSEQETKPPKRIVDCVTDAELLQWAQERVFAAISRSSGNKEEGFLAAGVLLGFVMRKEGAR